MENVRRALVYCVTHSDCQISFSFTANVLKVNIIQSGFISQGTFWELEALYNPVTKNQEVNL